jgi:hypothetical protein
MTLRRRPGEAAFPVRPFSVSKEKLLDVTAKRNYKKPC